MKRELNKNEFYICSKSLQDAMELLNSGHPKSALYVLKTPRRLLERDSIPTRMLALCLCLQADCYQALNDFSMSDGCLMKARAAALAIKDYSLVESIDSKMRLLNL